MYPVVLAVIALCYGCRACVITGHPEDTVAEVGENATLTCSTDFTICGDCVIYWEREINNKFKSIYSCETVFSGYRDRYSVSSGPDWSLTITGVQQSDARRYRCYVYSYGMRSSQNSLTATLIIPSLRTQEPKTEQSQQPNPGSTNSLSIVYSHSTTPTERNIPSVTEEGSHQSPSIQTSPPIYDPKLQDTSLVDNTTFIIVAGVITAVLLMVVISFLIYCLVFKRKHKATHTTRYASSLQDDDGERVGDGISEIQLHRVTSRCDQEKDNISSAGERSVESPGETVTVVVTPGLHQHAETKHNQDNLDKRLSTETDGSVKDGEKSNDKQNHPESMYAVVDKSRAKSKTLDAVSTEEASWKFSGGGKDGSKLNCETDAARTVVSYSKHESPSEHHTSTVAVKDSPVPGHVVDRQPPVIQYHLSKRQVSTATTQAQAGLEQTAESGENGLVKDNPIQRNVEGLVYADLDLSRGSARIINPEEEETVYAKMKSRVL